ncbi:4Fe-4S dicluster domain-containing protein [Magnetospirillum sulfuroxidans]|uniref:4Fe-4S dicluster domain-containing protein n=1 Tax=Magnetospirillum sulfuroxidans TaxID=611300 RepID=A0ABS5IB45_9PROT|nr:4Fe-4S dicluster domain-containing protein [Magnetospirillum sulfuroxidans]MBR9971649.1 4Fe-4S dicluster domain-containing protein [Magnetospirillum sulfuroxidans]
MSQIPKRPPPPAHVQQEARRRFLRSLLLGGAAVGAAMAGWLPVLGAQAHRLRPPGAIGEDDFLAACIKCGQCVQVCPVEAIVLSDITDGFGVGVPHIAARDQACDFSCDAVQCILACPTGALTHDLSKKEEVRMGVARLDKPEICLAHQGLGFKGQARGADYAGLHRYEAVDRWKPIPIADHPYDLELCDLCVRECPIEGAIALVPLSSDAADKRRIPEIRQSCVGCGMCEMICPTEPAAIVIDSRAQWRPA